MKKYIIDTNYLLRYLLNDNPKQADIVENYLLKAKNTEISITVPLLAFVECVFILIRVYKFEKNKVTEELINLAKLPYLDIERRDFIIEALSIFKNTTLGFIDILFFLEAKTNSKQLLTFDKKLAHLIQNQK